MTQDTLSDVLRAVRLTGAVFFDVAASAPWVAEAPPAREIAEQVMPGTEHLIEYHLVVSGGCYAGLIGEPAVWLSEGDLIVFPQGDPHVLSSAPGMRGKVDREEYRRPEGGSLPIAVALDGGGEHAAVICGFLGCDARPFNPLLATLPRTLVVERRQIAGSHLDSLMQLALTESKYPRAGSECMLSRLSELLFVEAIRSYVGGLPEGQRGWLAGLRDEHVGRALSLIHARPAHAWTLEDLAREAGLSRSVLAERFADFVGQPPMQYLAEWRMQLAATLLRSTTQSLAEIAERVGYGSESALSRAFKRLVGVAPATFRHGGAPGKDR